MHIHKGNTNQLNTMAERCESIEELKEILNCNSDYYYDWKEYINLLMERFHSNYTQMANRCHVSRNTVKTWCRDGNVPVTRETFIKIALGFHLDLTETNDLLQRYGKYPKLYAKVIEDAIVIFILTHTDFSGDGYEIYLQLKENLMTHFQDTLLPGETSLNTMEIESGILSQTTQKEFQCFILENRDSFHDSFQKLIDYLDLLIRSRYGNINQFVNATQLPPAFQKSLSRLHTKRECPARIKLILAGVYLNLSLEQINYMLSLSYMEPVCAKDSLECIVIYAVENAHLVEPGYELENAFILKNYQHDPTLQKRCNDIIYHFWLENESKDETNSIPYLEDNIGNYLTYVLEKINWNEEKYD